MIDSVVIATDGSASVERAVTVALDLADRFDATVHALYVVDDSEIDTAPDTIRDEFRDALEASADEALSAVKDAASGEVITAIETGRPASVICEYARDNDVDVVATGTRGRHGEHRFLLGSVAETVVRRCSVPVLTVRQLEGEPA
ncbi:MULTISPECIES: universal stress protein [unclassified Haladaptatus]|uniref:universal stress protein n=1 Tax=unclassified Haladaptatus TaxID=2622732 RepID=UPI0023E8B1A7|nr:MULTISPECIES: universal stress protein [unclassified Haladaptatus]